MNGIRGQAEGNREGWWRRQRRPDRGSPLARPASISLAGSAGEGSVKTSIGARSSFGCHSSPLDAEVKSREA